MSDPFELGAPLVAANRTGRDTTGLGRRSGSMREDDHRLLPRLRAQTQREPHRLDRADEDEPEAKVDHVLAEYLRRRQREF